MTLLPSCAAALLLAVRAAAPAPDAFPADTGSARPTTVVSADSLSPVLNGGPVPTEPVALRAWTSHAGASRDETGGAPMPAAFGQDTVPRKRPKAVVYSDAYGTRLKIHKTLSWAMLPLFAVSYVTGDQLITKGSDAPGWARDIHPVAATSTAVLFGANTITGAWNLWDARHDPNGRVRRYVHSVLFMTASAGFAYTGTKLAEDAQERQSKRGAHRNGALVSMGISTASWLLMLVKN